MCYTYTYTSAYSGSGNYAPDKRAALSGLLYSDTGNKYSVTGRGRITTMLTRGHSPELVLEGSGILLAPFRLDLLG